MHFSVRLQVEKCFLFEILGVEENSRFLSFGELFRLARSPFFSKVINFPVAYSGIGSTYVPPNFYAIE